MKHCDVVERGCGYWCREHVEAAEHCGLDGDSAICATFAQIHGCSCCPENYSKGTESDAIKALRVLSKALEDADRGLWYISGNDVAMEALNAVQAAVDSAIRELTEEN